MKTLVVKDTFAFLYLHEDIYSLTSILTSIHTYSEFFKVSKNKIGKYSTLKIESLSKEYSLQELVHEFMNYLLSVEKKQRGEL